MEKKEMIYYRLDEVDEKILAMLQDNARVSLKDIGAEVSMSPTAVGTRIDRMLAEGVLEGLSTFVIVDILSFNVIAGGTEVPVPFANVEIF